MIGQNVELDTGEMGFKLLQAIDDGKASPCHELGNSFLPD